MDFLDSRLGRVCGYEYSIVGTERTIERFHLASKQRRVQRHTRKKCAHAHAHCQCVRLSLVRGAAANTVRQLIPTFAPVPNPSPCHVALARSNKHTRDRNTGARHKNRTMYVLFVGKL